MCKMRKSRKQYCRVQKFASYSDEMDLLRHDGMVWGSAVLVSFGGSVTTNQYRVLQTDPLCLLVWKYFYPDGRGFFQEDAAPVYKGTRTR